MQSTDKSRITKLTECCLSCRKCLAAYALNVNNLQQFKIPTYAIAHSNCNYMKCSDIIEHFIPDHSDHINNTGQPYNDPLLLKFSKSQITTAIFLLPDQCFTYINLNKPHITVVSRAQVMRSIFVRFVVESNAAKLLTIQSLFKTNPTIPYHVVVVAQYQRKLCSRASCEYLDQLMVLQMFDDLLNNVV